MPPSIQRRARLRRPERSVNFRGKGVTFMASFVISWFAPVCVALGLLLSAGSARAQIQGCVDPGNVPIAVYNTIIDNADVDFGDLSEKVCKSIVKKGVSTCKAQVKSAAKCFRKAYDTNYDIAVKQCQQLEDSSDRADCKSEFKMIRDAGKDDSEDDQASALDVCAEEFAPALEAACLDGISM